MPTLAVIPARGGSKGIPRKNLVPIAGKPLIVWTIEQALDVPGLDVAVSTEDAEIAAVSREAGARVIERPADLAQDNTPTEPVVLHALEVTERSSGPVEAVLLLQATSPVRRPGTLARAVADLSRRGLDSLVGVVEQPPFLWSQDADGLARPAYDHLHRPRRQDLTPAARRYRETGSLYVTKTEIYRRHGNRLGGRIGLFVMEEVEGVDIDTLSDLAHAERLLTLESPPSR
jgi:CMP-N,N'-diacetyllegionaminic acid synthase